LDDDSAKEASENFAQPTENNRGGREESWGETCAIAKRLGLAASTLNSIFAKKDEIRQQIEKCG
jgi:hypothetical protein